MCVQERGAGRACGDAGEEGAPQEAACAGRREAGLNGSRDGDDDGGSRGRQGKDSEGDPRHDSPQPPTEPTSSLKEECRGGTRRQDEQRDTHRQGNKSQVSGFSRVTFRSTQVLIQAT
jgi:hypothetical protein